MPFLASDLHAFDQTTVDRIYKELWTDVLPVNGEYRGQAWGKRPHGKLALFTSAAWQGKVFNDNKVMNRILGRLWFEGDVSLGDEGQVVIYYPTLHLADNLRPVTPLLWLGRMTTGKATVNFTLERIFR